jgi:hypothetical protein
MALDHSRGRATEITWWLGPIAYVPVVASTVGGVAVAVPVGVVESVAAAIGVDVTASGVLLRWRSNLFIFRFMDMASASKQMMLVLK